MNKIACIGDKDSVLCFMSVGFNVFSVNSEEEAKKLLLSITSAEPCEYDIIYITEQYYISLADTIRRFEDRPVPAVISIPGKSGSLGTGIQMIKKLTEKAIGADITLY